jgi:hypothetical protein
VAPKQFVRITPDGAMPSLIFARVGVPVVVAAKGDLYYGGNGSQEDLSSPGAMTVVRLSPRSRQDVFSPALQIIIGRVTGRHHRIGLGPDGSIYVAIWNGIAKVKGDGPIAKIEHPVVVKDCDSDPADHNPANASSPFLRGLAVDSRGNVYVQQRAAIEF